MRKLELRLKELIDEQPDGIVGFQRTTKLSRRGIDILLGQRQPDWGIKAATIETICDALRIDLGDFLVLRDQPLQSLSDLIRSTNAGVVFCLGSFPVDARSSRSKIYVRMGGVQREAVGSWDVHVLADLAERFEGWSFRIEQTPCRVDVSLSDVGTHAEPALMTRKVNVIAVGSPLVCGFADVALCRLSAISELPFEFRWHFYGAPRPKDRPYQRFVETSAEQGVWLTNTSTLLQVPSWVDIQAMRKGRVYGDAAVVAVIPAHRGQACWTLLMGFSGPGSLAAARFVHSHHFSKLLKTHLQRRPGEPLFVPLEVKCRKLKGDSYDVEPGRTRAVPVDTHPVSRSSRCVQPACPLWMEPPELNECR